MNWVDPTGHAAEMPDDVGGKCAGIYDDSCGGHDPMSIGESLEVVGEMYAVIVVGAAGTLAVDVLLGTGAEATAATVSGQATISISEYVTRATQNANSQTVVLGKFTGVDNPTSYQNVAKALNATYFQLSDEVWDLLSKAGETWKVNQAFLQAQVSQGKTFILASDPATATGSFLKEVTFLLDQGYKFINSGQYWTAVK